MCSSFRLCGKLTVMAHLQFAERLASLSLLWLHLYGLLLSDMNVKFICWHKLKLFRFCEHVCYKLVMI